MRTVLMTVAALALCGLVAHAAENVKEIESLLKVHSDAIARADKARAIAVEKARDDTIAKLMKLAGRAYTEKDRVSETNAWRSVLQLDRQHQRARRYFSDLGTLEQVEKDLGEPSADESAQPTKLVGKWNMMFSNKAAGPLVIPKDGVVRRIDGENGTGKIVLERGEALLRIPAFVERYTMMGDRIFVEQWAPASTYPASAPLIFGYGVRAD